MTCHCWTSLLLCLTVHLVHGGHVLETADREEVEGVGKTCISAEAPVVDSGPHILSNIISSTDHIGNESTFLKNFI